MTLATVAQTPIGVLRSPATIRERCRNVLDAAAGGRSPHFRIDRSRLDAAAERVEAATRRRYPDLRIPYHSRWRHFKAGGVDRRSELDRALQGRDAAGCARARIDLTVVSVLLDAGAGTEWAYVERESGDRFTRSEGLAVASFRAFVAGAFSARRDDPLRADAAALSRIDAAALARIFQVSGDNPLVGLEGRASLLRRLGVALVAREEIFDDLARPGGLFETLIPDDENALTAVDLLHALQDGLSSIWLSGNALDGVPLGDVWRHPYAGGDGRTAGWVPFHKLSQWLAYSLFEPFEWAGIGIVDPDALTALPEYRNGGLLIDTGVLTLLDPRLNRQTFDVASELVVEWRALTVALIDELAPLVRGRLAFPELPLACVLEGGTWGAGRDLAQELRDGAPPFAIRSDGTVF
ncbi:MAG TPA: URC4/urg3 family protein [Casimicrobiaceae bacterium]